MPIKIKEVNMAKKFEKVCLVMVLLMCLFINPAYSSEWYEGGNLHKATVKTWSQSSYSNRLATSADWFISITKSHNPNLKNKLDNLSTSEYLATLKQFSIQLEKCISDTVSIKSKDSNFAKSDDQIAEIASLCYISLYGVK
jgi:hypothetical protein